MTEELKLNNPWMIAVWPGMGNVAISAGYYLMAKLEMHLLAEFSARELFEVEHVEVRDGLIRTGQLPRNRLFLWSDPQEQRDIIVFIGEAQPPSGKYAFCDQLIQYAQQLKVQQVFTFAAMATQMHPEHASRVFAAATDAESLRALEEMELEVLSEGHISGLNGVLLGVAAEAGLRGACLLGEMPHIFSQLPFPKASLAVLKVFTQLAGIRLDFDELAEQARVTEQKLGQILAEVEHRLEREKEPGEELGYEYQSDEDEEQLSRKDRERIESLFQQAASDRSKAYELKRELDRLECFKEYEDRFLDLFRK